MFPGNMGNMQAMVKKMQKMQAEMVKAQEALQARIFEATAGGGAVCVTMSGKKEMKSIKISPQAVDPEDVELLEDLLLSAVNQVLHEIDEVSEKEMAKITGGIKLPGM